MTLHLVGLGLGQDGMSLAARKVAEAADARFVETYTSRPPDGLEDRVGPCEAVGRDEVEDGGTILEAARDGDAALLVPGDPLAATTHTDLRLRAHEEGIDVEVVHGASALTAVPGLLGLSHYKFGRGTTLVTPQPGYAPESPYDVIGGNLDRGLHTLVLLDTGDGEAYLTADDAIAFLLEVEERRGEDVMPQDRLVCVVARVGEPDARCVAGPAGELVEENLGDPLHTLVVPGELHFKEAEALEVLAGWDRGPDAES